MNTLPDIFFCQTLEARSLSPVEARSLSHTKPCNTKRTSKTPSILALGMTAFLIFFVWGACVSAQPSATINADTTSGLNRVWLYSGLGVDYYNYGAGEGGITFVFGQQNATNQNIITLRGSITGIFLGSDGGSGVQKGNDIGLLYGFAKVNAYSHLSIAAGLGYTFHGYIIPGTIGFPFQAQAFLNARIIGFGISVFGNLNFTQSFVGAALCIAIGKLW